jgi:Raf kinase inhibitor-like YbhB/YbcL family protein
LVREIFWRLGSRGRSFLVRAPSLHLWIARVAVFFLVASAVCSAAAQNKLEISSPAFKADGDIPVQFSCKGDNMNPPLEIRGVPSAAKSLVLILDDPDAPGGLFTHWIVWNILPSTSGIAQKSVPGGGREGTNDFGKRGYGGPCPPSGTHRYVFHILALDQKLDLQAGAKRGAVDKAIAGHAIAEGALTGRFSH